MATGAPVAGPTPEEVQHDMQTTRTHLGAGVQALGDKAAGYAHDAAEAVGDACRGTRDALHAARDAVGHAATDVVAFAGRALDIRRHVRRYPWAAVGAAVALGFACGRLITRRQRPPAG
jgi:ElaB/YqjD/DUF883 family membrane-anchored ribosome-binding protein